MINSYILTLKNNRVTVSEYADGTLTILKYRGEEEQTYNELKFWSWFKQKIGYKDEELSFVVVTDDEAFLIPATSEIKLHKTSALDNDSYVNSEIISLSKGLFVLSFPQRVAPTLQSKKEPQKPEPKTEEPLSENALAGYFRQQTQEFKN